MKKYIILSIVILLSVSGFVAIFYGNRDNKINNFSIEEYQEYISKFPSTENVGNIENQKQAKEKAEQLWITKYGNNIKKKKPYNVSYDKQNKIWLVEGTLPKNALGGVPHILIDGTTGTVLAIWHDK